MEKISGRERVARRRAALRERGLRPKQFWLPDVTNPEFIAQARADARAIAKSADSAEAQAWLDSLVDSESWPAWDPK